MNQGELVYFQQEEDEQQQLRPGQNLVQTINSYFQSKSQSQSFKLRPSPARREQMLGYYLQIPQESLTQVKKEVFGEVYQKYTFRDKCLKIYSQECQHLYRNQITVLHKLAPFLPLQFKFKHDLRLLKFDDLGHSLSSRYLNFTKRKLKDGQTAFLIEEKREYRALVEKEMFGLLSLIEQVVSLIEAFQRKIIFFNINLQSLSLSKGKLRSYNFQAALSCAYIFVQEKKVGALAEPVLKHRGDWLTIPQYLAPQVLEWINTGNLIDFFEFPSAVDIFSLGCSIIQLLSKKPLWLPFKVLHKQKLGSKGCLSVGRNPIDILKIQRQQIEKAIGQLKADQEIKQLLRRMTDPRRERRADCVQLRQLLKKLYC